MADYTGQNIFEKLGALIPGYKGYVEREGRRTTDQVLRRETARRLVDAVAGVDEVALQLVERKDLKGVEALDRLKGRMRSTADQIRYASYGESGFFDDVQVGAEELDKLYRFDLEISEAVAEVGSMAKALHSSGDVKGDVAALLEKLSSLTDSINGRDNVITEVV